jgi:hypothetical protein
MGGYAMAIKRTYVYRDGKIVEVTSVKNRRNLPTIDKKRMTARDAVMMGVPEASHMGWETIGKMKKEGRTCYDDIRR